jgi:hypothetical protein
MRYSYIIPEGRRGRDRMVIWFYNYLCNQSQSPLKFWGRIPHMSRWTCATLCDKVCQWLAIGRWFLPDTPDSSTNKTELNDITEKWR